MVQQKSKALRAMLCGRGATTTKARARIKFELNCRTKYVKILEYAFISSAINVELTWLLAALDERVG